MPFWCKIYLPLTLCNFLMYIDIVSGFWYFKVSSANPLPNKSPKTNQNRFQTLRKPKTARNFTSLNNPPNHRCSNRRINLCSNQKVRKSYRILTNSNTKSLVRRALALPPALNCTSAKRKNRRTSHWIS